MKMKLRPRYYCEHCGKGSGNPAHMRKHEAGCTANPNRTCGMCAQVGNEQKPIEDLIAALISHDHEYDKGLVTLKELANDCPACILAAIRQSKVQTPDEYDEEGIIPGIRVNYDFTAEKNAFWNDLNESKSY